MNSELINDMSDNSVRAEEIFHLSTMAWGGNSSAANLEEAFESDPESLLHAIGFSEGAIYEMEEFIDALHEESKTGWLVKFSTPVPTRFYGSGYSFSWGFYTSKWFYGDDYEQLCRDALKWKDAFIESKRKSMSGGQSA